jgi:hypothetical protein
VLCLPGLFFLTFLLSKIASGPPPCPTDLDYTRLQTSMQSTVGEMASQPNKDAEKTKQHDVEPSDFFFFEPTPTPLDTNTTSEPGSIIFSIVDGLMTFVRTKIFAKKPDPQCDESAAAPSNDGRINSEANSTDDASKAEFGKFDPSLGRKLARNLQLYRSRLDPSEEEMAGECRTPCLCPF